MYRIQVYLQMGSGGEGGEGGEGAGRLSIPHRRPGNDRGHHCESPFSLRHQGSADGNSKVRRGVKRTSPPKSGKEPNGPAGKTNGPIAKRTVPGVIWLLGPFVDASDGFREPISRSRDFCVGSPAGTQVLHLIPGPKIGQFKRF